MDIIFKDDMVKESKTWKNPMLLFFVLAVLFPLTLIWNNIKITEFILGEVFFLIVGSYFLYGYLYAYKYKVVVTNEKIVLKLYLKTLKFNLKI